MSAKKSLYAICGTAMIVAAALARTAWEGGPELIGLVIVGLVTLIASADLPANTKGRTR